MVAPSMREAAAAGVLGRRVLLRWAVAVTIASGIAMTLPARAAPQTINGTLIDLQSDQPIPLGLVIMFTESGDSVTSTVTDVSGSFSLSSPTPGSFVLLAGALGYRETPAGAFELGDGGVMDVEYRLAPEPMPIDALVVSLERPVQAHRLVSNGFVRRFQRGLGAFVTPHDIEESTARSTEGLLTHIPGVRVSEVRIARQVAGELTPDELQRGLGNGGEQWTIYPRPDIGEVVQIRGSGGGWCTPTVYVDGVRTFYDTDMTSYAQALTLSTVTPLGSVEAIEVYRRPAEIPVEFSPGPESNCGVLVVWTKSGLAPGQRPATRVAASEVGQGFERLPTVEARGAPPAPGENIRVELDDDAAQPMGLPPTWAGTFVGVRDGDLVAVDERSGRPVAVPIPGVEALHVRRERAASRAVLRGTLVGGAAAGGTWLGLHFLCAWSACNATVESPWLPAGAVGLLVGYAVYKQGPGDHWVASAVPEVTPGPAGVGLTFRLPADRR